MINVKELRIGNWIEIKPPPNCDSGICMVEVIKRSSASLHCESEDYFIADVPYEKIKPIELTPSILEQCGFEKNEDSGNWHFEEYKIHRYGEHYFYVGERDEKFYHYRKCDDDYYSSMWPQLTSLHQLQNLFYFLVGEELNFQSQTQKQKQ